MTKHRVEKIPYENGSGVRYVCANCGLHMGIIHKNYPELNQIDYENGECPGGPLDETIIIGFREFYYSPGYGGNITSIIRRLHGGSGRYSRVEKVTREDFEEEFGTCLAIEFGLNGEFEAVTHKYIVRICEYNGNEWMESFERTPEWFRKVGGGQ